MTRFLVLMTMSRTAYGMAFMVWPASLPFVMAEWNLGAAQAGLVQTSANLAYAVSLFVTAWLADRFGAGRVFELSSWASCAAFAACAFWADSFASALILFTALAVTLGGAYAPALMLTAQTAPEGRRGFAVGWILAGASLGYFAVLVFCAIAAPRLGVSDAWRLLMAAPLVAAVTGALARRASTEQGPAPESEAPSPGDLLRAFTARRSVLLTTGYVAHAWELLGMWAWAPAFLTLSLAAADLPAAVAGLVVAASLHLSGAASTLLCGAASDRWGQRRVLVWVALAGALCSFAFGWLQPFGVAVLVGAAALYGFAALGDSGVLSAAMADAVSPALLGRVLALRSIVGFGAGALAPVALGLILDLSNPGGGPPVVWGWAFAALGLGGLLAAACAALLPSDPRSRARDAGTLA